ncbi:hypothetical protein AURDEDRAFT_43103, partial [Auricularia subglabra TFB-10046 SS5]
VSGRFTVEVHFCAPTARRAAHADTLLVMAPGATYNTLYWDLPLQPETYSFVRLANSQGFATLSIARVGDGLSSRPDPINVLQLPIQVAAQVEILKLAREGKIPGFRGRFRNVVGIGHSLSSAILNGVIVEAPQVIDAAIFTGYGHADPSNMLFPTTGFGFIPANEAGIPRFRNLPDGYLTTQNITSRTVFYGPPGTFDPDVLAFDEAHKDTVSIGEFNTLFTSSVAAPRFRGPVLTVDGAFDTSFCPTQACDTLAREAQFYPNARSVEFVVIQGSGHDLNLHLTAPGFFQTLLSWIVRHG